MSSKNKAEEETFDDFIRIENNNLQLTNKILDDEVPLFKNFFDIQQRLFYLHFPGILVDNYHLNDYEKIIIQAYVKNIYLLYDAHSLVIRGHYGSANIIQRQIFEFLLLGKYMSIKKDNKIAEKWLENNQFDTYNNIIKLLDKPNKFYFHSFWVILCNFTHASTSSHQVGNAINGEEVYKSYNFILLLLRCNYHLLSSCFINRRLVYRTDQYKDPKERKELEFKAGILKKAISKPFSKLGKSLIKDYESAWTFKK
jgi:hypothetical protein